MRGRLSYLMCGCTLVAACHRGAAGMEVLTPVLSTARVYYDDGPAFRDSVRMVVRDGAAWRTVWAQATSAQPAPPPLPAVDFEREMVLVVGAGKMTPGDQIHVDSAGVRRDFFVAVVRTIVQCRPFPADAYPLEIVRVDQISLPQFVWRTDEFAQYKRAV